MQRKRAPSDAARTSPTKGHSRTARPTPRSHGARSKGCFCCSRACAQVSRLVRSSWTLARRSNYRNGRQTAGFISVYVSRGIVESSDDRGFQGRSQLSDYHASAGLQVTGQNIFDRPAPNQDLSEFWLPTWLVGRWAGRTSGKPAGISVWPVTPLGSAFCKNWVCGGGFSLLTLFFYLGRILQHGRFPGILRGVWRSRRVGLSAKGKCSGGLACCESP